MTVEGLTNYEIEILRHLSGDKVEGMIWGAAMSVSIECLHEGGYIRREKWHSGILYVITEKGKAAVEASDDKA